MTSSFSLLSFFSEYPIAFISLSIFLSGIIMSLVGVVVDRLPHQLSWRDDPIENLKLTSPAYSRCDSCGYKLKFLDLIPVFGWFINKGICRNCHCKVSFSYPFMEFLGMAVCGAIAFWYGFGAISLFLIFLALVLMFLSWIDLTEGWLPAVVTIPLFWLGLLFSPFEINAEYRIIGAFLGYFLMLISMYLVGKSKGLDIMHGGDLMLATTIGAWVGFQDLSIALFIASLAYIPYALYLRKKNDCIFIPFGPALSIGFLSVIIFEPVNLYF